jgi:ABC-type Zn uptake system ZnuABC Zn-binding protein ZnuA
MARIIGDNQVTVTTLIPPGVDPHTYVPTDDQISAIQEADIVFVNGLGLDQPTIDFIEAHRPDRTFFVVDFARNVPSPTHPQPPDIPIYAKDVGDDPHLWLDPMLVHIYAETISHSLIIIDGLNEPYFNNRYLDYLAQIQQMQTDTAAAMATIPEENRGKLITEHNSLIHFARRYGLEVAATLAEEGETAVQEAIAEVSPPAVFVEGGPASDALTLIAGGAGIEVCTLYTDTITDPNMGYLQMMEYDVAEIVRCLGG